MMSVIRVFVAVVVFGFFAILFLLGFVALGLELELEWKLGWRRFGHWL